jgi:hypothetical protein
MIFSDASYLHGIVVDGTSGKNHVVMNDVTWTFEFKFFHSFSILLLKDLSWLMNIELYIKTFEQVMQ